MCLVQMESHRFLFYQRHEPHLFDDFNAQSEAAPCRELFRLKETSQNFFKNEFMMNIYII